MFTTLQIVIYIAFKIFEIKKNSNDHCLIIRMNIRNRSEAENKSKLTSYFWYAPNKYDDGFWLLIANMLLTQFGTF